ncbi:MAG: sulfotransferase [Cyanobacteria bacterium J06635_10]
MNEFSPVLPVKLLNQIGPFFGKIAGSQSLSSQQLMQQAEKVTGLQDWGEDKSFLKPLDILIEDANSLTDISFTGKLLLKKDILNSLTNRLQLQRLWNKYPQILKRRIEKPLFIMSLPRTGTTFLLNLLSQNPDTRVPLQWEMLNPIPIEGYNGSREKDPRIVLAEKYARQFYRFMPRVAKIHYMNPYGAGECRFLLQNSFVCKYYFTLLPLFTYNNWLDNCDARFAYKEYLKQLQLLDFTHTNKHWLLKAPTHTPFIREVLEVLPDARLIQIHREPVEFVGSAISGVVTVRNCVLQNADANVIAQEFLLELSRRMEQYLEARKAVGWHRFCDISYNQLVSKPIETVQKIYAFFGLNFSSAAKNKMSAWLEENPQHKLGVHRYKLQQFGLNEKTVNSHFGEYLKEFANYLKKV